jgi:hypothetical protein
LNQTDLTLAGGTDTLVFVTSGPASVADLASGTTISIGPASGSVTISDITSDPAAIVDLIGGVGGLTSVSAVLLALTKDSAGTHTQLSLGNGNMLAFANTPIGYLASGSHFKID